MNTSLYSFLAAIIWFNVAMLFVFILSRRTYFLVKYSTSGLLICAALGIFRMLLPLDFDFAYVVRSYVVMPFVRNAYNADVMPGLEYLKLGTVIICVWVAGSLSVLVKTFYQLAIESKARKRYRITRNRQVERVFRKMNLKRAEIIVSPDISVPMVTGIFKAHIYLPKILLTDDQLKLIILHEYQHFKSRDTLIKLFYLALSALFWWNPVVHKFRDKLDELLELRCDANVTEKMDDEDKQRYLSAILAVVKQFRIVVREKDPIASASLVKVTSDNLIKQRFNFVLSDHKKAPIGQMAMVSFLTALFMLSFMVLVQPAEFPGEDELEAGTMITPENAYVLVLDDGRMELYVDGEFLWEVSEAELNDDLHSGLPIYERRN